jgi:hypothetical protein
VGAGPAQGPPIARVSGLFPWIVLATFLLPALLGGLLTMSLSGALTGLLWGGLVRVFLLHHVTWSINSICHVFGTRSRSSRHDESRNNPIMACSASVRAGTTPTTPSRPRPATGCAGGSSTPPGS